MGSKTRAPKRRTTVIPRTGVNNRGTREISAGSKISAHQQRSRLVGSRCTEVDALKTCSYLISGVAHDAPMTTTNYKAVYSSALYIHGLDSYRKKFNLHTVHFYTCHILAKQSEALVPPNPKLLESATFTSRCCAVCAT